MPLSSFEKLHKSIFNVRVNINIEWTINNYNSWCHCWLIIGSNIIQNKVYKIEDLLYSLLSGMILLLKRTMKLKYSCLGTYVCIYFYYTCFTKSSTPMFLLLLGNFCITRLIWIYCFHIQLQYKLRSTFSHIHYHICYIKKSFPIMALQHTLTLKLIEHQGRYLMTVIIIEFDKPN